MTVEFTTSQDNFPANINDLQIQHLTLFFAGAEEEGILLNIPNFSFKEAGSNASIVASAQTNDNGIVSTRSGSIGNLIQAIGKSPSGKWTLQLENTPAVKDYFKNEKITDIIFVITYKGETHPWPA